MIRRTLPLLALCALGLTACVDYEAPLPRRDRLHFPVGLALHPSGDHLYVVNSNFDSRYEAGRGGTVSVIDTRTLQLQPERSPFIPSFGSQIRLNADATRAYVATRQGDTIVALSVSASGDSVACAQPDGALSSDPSACLVRRVPDTRSGARVPADPFALDVSTVTRTIDGQALPIDVVNISHLSGTNVSTLALPEGRLAGASLRAAPIVRGGNALARRPGTMELYVASRNSNVIAVYAPYISPTGQVEALFAVRNITLSNATNNQGNTVPVDARGIAFDKAGERLFVTTRTPRALHTFTVRPTDLADGQGVSHDLVSVLPLPRQPAEVLVHEPDHADALLYVPSYGDRTIQVIDPQRAIVIDTITLDERPYGMVIDPVTTRCRFAGDVCRGYVSLFTDTASASTSCDDSDAGCGAVAVIDLDPASPRYHQVIAKIH